MNKRPLVKVTGEKTPTTFFFCTDFDFLLSDVKASWQRMPFLPANEISIPVDVECPSLSYTLTQWKAST